MNLIMIASWLRYFTYFLIIDKIAKVTLTLFRMFYEILAFLLIIMCYLFIVSALFFSLFRDVILVSFNLYRLPLKMLLFSKPSRVLSGNFST